MKALTIAQPYAELIVRGEKPIENRTWDTRYRGPLFIHAGQSREWLSPGDEQRYPGMPFGALVAVVQLVACLRLDAEWPPQYAHLKAHEHAHGPWCWVLQDVVPIVPPYRMRGFQGLWYVPPEIKRAVMLAPARGGR